MSHALGISYKKLVSLIEEMTENDFIQLAKDELGLTSKGRKRALEIIRAHRLWETYLSERTGIHKEKWHDLAEKKELNAS